MDGAQGMVDDGLADLIPPVDVALGQHVGPLPAGCVATKAGPAFAASDSIRVTLYGRGGHASMPHATVDPIVLAAAIVLRLQTIVSREIEAGEPAVVTVGRIAAGTKANIIADQAELQINIRSYSESTREAILAAIRRIVTAECAASNSPRDPDFEFLDRAPLTDNDLDVTARVDNAFAGVFGDRVVVPPRCWAAKISATLPGSGSAVYLLALRWRRSGRVLEGRSGRPARQRHPGQPLAALRPGYPADSRHRHHGAGCGRSELVGGLRALFVKL